jgi:hypothetical protein
MSASEPAPALSVEARLDELQRQSELRRTELREIAAQLPSAVSRRAILRAMLADLRSAPDKMGILRRALGKAARTPGDAWRAARHRRRES